MDIDLETIYSVIIDKRYFLKVLRNINGGGTLSLYDLENEEELIFQKDVDLMHDAMFGPDIYDISYWETLALDFIDNNL